MRLDVTETPASSRGMCVLTLSHKDQKLTWDVSVYDRVSFADIATNFDCINAYWATLPPDRLAQIWAIYGDIHQILQTGFDVHQLDTALQERVAALYNLMPYTEIKHWTDYKGEVKIPGTIPYEYTASDADALNYPRELTYLRRDYQELAALSVALRPMVPIWGEYIKLTEDPNGIMFKEYGAMGLLYRTELPFVEPMERLRLYMEHWVQTQPVSHAAILGGLGTGLLPAWLLAGCVVRRLVFSRLQPVEEKESIVANVYRFVNSQIKSLDSSFDGKVNPKKLPMEMNEEDNSSLADMYKVKPEFPDADLVAMNIYTERLYDMANRIDPTIPVALVDECMRTVEAIAHETIKPHQKTIAQWVIKPALSPRGIPYLDKGPIMRVLAVTQAALWHWGFLDIAAMVTAVQRPSRGASSIAWGAENRSRVPKELVDELTLLYPYYRRQRGKDKSVRHLNVAYRALDALCDLITKSEWQLHAPAPIAEKIETIGTARLLIIPPDFRASLARLLIRLAQPQR